MLDARDLAEAIARQRSVKGAVDTLQVFTGTTDILLADQPYITRIRAAWQLLKPLTAAR